MGPHAAASRPMTLSEQADELEEQMMQELNDKIATKSVLFTLADGKIEIEGGAPLLAQNPGKYFLMGADPRLPTMPEKPTLHRLLQAPLRLDQPPAAERDACAQGRPSTRRWCWRACCTTSPW